MESGVELEFVLEIEFEFKAGFEIDLEFVIEIEFQFKFEIALELEFAFALEFGFKELTFGPISIPTGVPFALRHPPKRPRISHARHLPLGVRGAGGDGQATEKTSLAPLNVPRKNTAPTVGR